FEIEPPTAADMAARRADVLSRGLPYSSLEPVDDNAPLPPGSRHQRVPDPIPPQSPARRRLTLMAIGLGLALFVIAGYFFVLKAKEHLTRAPANQPAPSWQR
ncbi:MAG: hypothetical protein K2X32_12500, partial [Phycisphaerales bacterium]|nr:hypothetical protein [Phycisphaerales bacterium]